MNELFEKLNVKQEVAAALERFKKWKNNDETVVFPVITDLHSALVTEDPLRSMRRETASHIKIMNFAAKEFGADFTANLGDNGLDVPLKTRDEQLELAKRIIEYHRESAIRPVIFAVGNHDTVSGNVTAADWGKAFREMNSDHFMVTGTDDAYGFYDIPGKKVRIFWLFSDETPSFYSEEQLLFVKEHLENMPQEMTAVILQHVCIRKVGAWRSNPDRWKPPQFVKMHTVFAEFKQNGGDLAAVFAGDSHFNGYELSDNINYFVFQGYGGIGGLDTQRPDHALRADELNPACGFNDTFDSSKTFMIDMIALKPEKRELAVFRIGAGGSCFDQSAVW